MKRLVYLISTFLILAGMYGGGVGAGEIFWNSDQIGSNLYKYPARKFSANENQMSDSDKRFYVEWTKSEPIATHDVALAQSPNGWAAAWSYADRNQAKKNALRNCQRHIGSICKIVDINRQSAFIKRRGSSGSSSTASSSSSTAQGSVFCYRASSVATRRYFYKPTTRRCESGDFEITEQEFDDRKAPLYVASTSSSTKPSTVSKSTSESSKQKMVWCATKERYQWISESRCTEIKGISHDSPTQAFGTHSRLKSDSASSFSSTAPTTQQLTQVTNAEKAANLGEEHKSDSSASTASSSSSSSSTTTQTAQTTTTQPSTVGKSALELAFWQTIHDTDDPDMFREYLLQFPQGVYAGLAKLKIKKLGGDTSTVASTIPNLDYGDYYALVIGNNKYDHLRNLRTAVNDARAVSTLLEDGYGFNVKLLENATRSDILNSITELRGKVGRKDNVLIYYAGHGVEDKAADEGFWIPTDANLEEQDNWLSTDRVRKQIKAMPAKHVMVVLTSGGLEPVMDGGGASGDHSVFADAFLRILQENESVLDGHKFFTSLRNRVMMNSEQTPEYGDIRKAGHDGGDFLFVRQ